MTPRLQAERRMAVFCGVGLLVLVLLAALTSGCGMEADIISPRWGLRTSTTEYPAVPGYWTAEELDAHAEPLLNAFPETMLRYALRDVWVWPVEELQGCGSWPGDFAGCMLSRAWLLVETRPCRYETALTHELVHSVLEFAGTPDDLHEDTDLWARADKRVGVCE